MTPRPISISKTDLLAPITVSKTDYFNNSTRHTELKERLKKIDKTTKHTVFKTDNLPNLT